MLETVIKIINSKVKHVSREKKTFTQYWLSHDYIKLYNESDSNNILVIIVIYAYFLKILSTLSLTICITSCGII